MEKDIKRLPEAAPTANKVFLSSDVVPTICPTKEPRAAPVAIMGPSVPKGLPVPITNAADNGCYKRVH